MPQLTVSPTILTMRLALRPLSRPFPLRAAPLARGIKIRSQDPKDKPIDSPGGEATTAPFKNGSAGSGPKANDGQYSASTIANEEGDYTNQERATPDVNKEAREADEAALKKEKK
ncbi:unnamed protein product [Cutaneotrichosporon oleaginosum]